MKQPRQNDFENNIYVLSKNNPQLSEKEVQNELKNLPKRLSILRLDPPGSHLGAPGGHLGDPGLKNHPPGLQKSPQKLQKPLPGPQKWPLRPLKSLKNNLFL